MTETARAEAEELSMRVLGIIGAYRMGAALDARELDPRRSAPEPPDTGLMRPGGFEPPTRGLEVRRSVP